MNCSRWCGGMSGRVCGPMCGRVRGGGYMLEVCGPMCGRVSGPTRVQPVTSGGGVVFGGEAHAHRRIIADPLT